MKMLICTIFMLFLAICDGSPEKGGLSLDEQKKLVDTLNTDRQEMSKAFRARNSYKVDFKNLTYDTVLEKIDFCDLDTGTWAPLMVDSIYRKAVEYANVIAKKLGYVRYHPSLSFFDPNKRTIGCSKSVECSKEVDKTVPLNVPKDIAGKMIRWNGACVLRPGNGQLSDDFLSELEKDGMADVSKYGKMLGVAEPSSVDTTTVTEKPGNEAEASSGRINFNLTVFLAILVFYF